MRKCCDQATDIPSKQASDRVCHCEQNPSNNPYHPPGKTTSEVRLLIDDALRGQHHPTFTTSLELHGTRCLSISVRYTCQPQDLSRKENRPLEKVCSRVSVKRARLQLIRARAKLQVFLSSFSSIACPHEQAGVFTGAVSQGDYGQVDNFLVLRSEPLSTTSLART